MALRLPRRRGTVLTVSSAAGTRPPHLLLSGYVPTSSLVASLPAAPETPRPPGLLYPGRRQGVAHKARAHAPDTDGHDRRRGLGSPSQSGAERDKGRNSAAWDGALRSVLAEGRRAEGKGRFQTPEVPEWVRGTACPLWSLNRRADLEGKRNTFMTVLARCQLLSCAHHPSPHNLLFSSHHFEE